MRGIRVGAAARSRGPLLAGFVMLGGAGNSLPINSSGLTVLDLAFGGDIKRTENSLTIEDKASGISIQATEGEVIYIDRQAGRWLTVSELADGSHNVAGVEWAISPGESGKNFECRSGDGRLIAAFNWTPKETK